jgi:hypothetical protein
LCDIDIAFGIHGQLAIEAIKARRAKANFVFGFFALKRKVEQFLGALFNKFQFLI